MGVPLRENKIYTKELNAQTQAVFRGLTQLGTAAISSNALVLGSGSENDKETTSTPNSNFVEFRFENTAASGDNRGVYNRFYIAGAGSGGESLRTYTEVVDVAAGTAHGAHISLGFASTGSITGLGVAGRNTLHIPNQAQSGGTYAAVQAEIWADGASSDISGATAHAVWRTVVDGNATGAATVHNFMDFSLPAALVGSGGMVDTDITTHTAYAGLPILVNGVVKYIPVVND